MLLHERFCERARAHPDRIAIRFEGATITYGELEARAVAAAALVADAGIEVGDRFAWLGANQPFIIELLVAASRLRAILVPLNTRLSPAEHGVQLEHSGAELLICEPATEAPARAALPSGSRLVVSDGSGLCGPTAETEQATGTALASAGRDDDPLLLVYTSGTTGAPKGAVHTQRSIEVTLANGIESQDLTADDVTLNFLPMFHVGGLNIQTLPTLAVGATLVLHRAFDAGHALDDIERFGVTTSVYVPATMRATLDHPRWHTADLSSIRGLQTGSSVLPPSLLRAFIARGLAPGQVYGSTETGPTCVVLSSDECHHIGSAGRVAPDSEIRVIDGELQVRGEHLFDRYWRNPAATEAAFDDGWYRTGDLASIDDQGLVWIEGRVDDLIISGGENIDPVEVEDVLAHAPGVAEIAIVAGLDDRWGQVPVAVIVADGAPPTLQVLRSHAQGRLASYKLPARLEIVDALPRTALGKVQRFHLRHRH